MPGSYEQHLEVARMLAQINGDYEKDACGMTLCDNIVW